MIAALTEMAALTFYAISCCALLGAVAVQIRLFSEAGLSAPTLMLKPWKAVSVMADNLSLFTTPSQFKRFFMFALLIFVTFVALVVGRSIELGHLPS